MDKWTAQQRLAIDTDGRDVLVTASAGTGKTSVLAARCLRLLADAKAGIDVRQMLVLTFTNAAAEEMRTRIAASLREECRRSGEKRLKRQLMLIDAADIGTIDSFCQRLVREHFYRLGIDPAVTLIDEDEQRLLRARILEETVAWAWQQANLVEGLCELLADRNITGNGYNFLQHIVAISEYLDGVADRSDWCARAVAINQLAGDAARELAGHEMELLRSKLQMCREQVIFAMSMDQRLAGGHWQDALSDDRLACIDKCIGLAAKGDAKGVAVAIGEYKDGKHSFARRPKGMDEETRDLIQEPANKAMAAFVKLKDLAILNPDYATIVGGATSRQSTILIELVKRFDHLYQESKRKANCLDFGDLEHLAARLLQDGGKPSDIATKLRSRYKAIFVDEYQDINSVQKQILSLLTAGRNVFAVGDVKQSIYAFRGAVPEIFLNDLKAAENTPEDAQRVDLTGNFRSRREVLDLVNAVFGRLMSSSVAGIDYDERARLTGQFRYEPLHSSDSAVELHLIDASAAAEGPEAAEDTAGADDSDTRDKVTKGQAEAALIAQRIRQMVGGGRQKPAFDIFDKDTGTYRPVECRDIVILMRSLGGANDLAEVLSLAGIPVHSQSGVGYFETTEITDCLALLKVLDNPQNDIELAAVLRSPMFGVTDTQLLQIRLSGKADEAGRKPSFSQLVAAYVRTGADEMLRSRLVAIFETLHRWRLLASRETIANMLWQAFRETGYLSFVAGLPKGRQRRANLLDLHSRAVQFAGFATASGASLGAFVEFIQKLMEEGGDYKPADVMAPGENTVRIMSVHKSKGLEFPVVFLAGLEKRFNFQDASGECLFDSRTTLGLGIVDGRKHARLRSMTGEVIAAKKLADGVAEEMRVLYVALTRARERLVLTATGQKRACRKILLNGAQVDGVLPQWIVASCRSSLEWLLYAMSRCRELHDAFGTGQDVAPDAAPLLHVTVLGAREQDSLAESVTSIRQIHRVPIKTGETQDGHGSAIAGLVHSVSDSLRWQYKWRPLTETPAKMSVTQLTHMGDEYAAIDISTALDRMPAAMADKPHDSIEARTLGTATHMVMQSLDMGSTLNDAAVKETIAELVNKGAITSTAAAAIDTAGIIGFFRTEPGRVVRDNPAAVLREWPFTFAMPVTEYAPMTSTAAGEDSIIIQGIIDLLVPLAGKIVIIDFKTDRISKAQVQGRAEVYSQQLRLYARAARAILNATVSEEWLYFLNCSTAVKLGR
jgi:ATP-dependent helicase/nuclease subunit A